MCDMCCVKWVLDDGMVFYQNRREYSIMNYEEQQQNPFQERLKQLIQALKQQKLSPQIIGFKKQLFTQLYKSLKQREESFKQFLKPDSYQQTYSEQTKSHKRNLNQLIYKCEMEKVEYLLKEYLRVRMAKVQKYCFYLYANQGVAQRKLSESEYVFMKKIAEFKYQYLDENVLKSIPKPYRGMSGLESTISKSKDIPLQLDTKQSRIQFPQPQQSQYVFCQILGNPDLYRFQADIPLGNLEEKSIIPINSTIYTQYKFVAKMIAEGNAVLL